jgi:hypothetical protein
MRLRQCATCFAVKRQLGPAVRGAHEYHECNLLLRFIYDLVRARDPQYFSNSLPQVGIFVSSHSRQGFPGPSSVSPLTVMSLIFLFTTVCSSSYPSQVPTLSYGTKPCSDFGVPTTSAVCTVNHTASLCKSPRPCSQLGRPDEPSSYWRHLRQHHSPDVEAFLLVSIPKIAWELQVFYAQWNPQWKWCRRRTLR